MASSRTVTIVCGFLLFIVVATPQSTEAVVNCGDVTQNLAACLVFLERGVGPSAACCTGVKTLQSKATTTSDRRTACKCMRSSAAAFPSINPKNTAALPGKCGVTLSVTAGPKTDCSKIQ